MGMKKYRFVGLNRDVWLPDNIKVEIDIVPASRRNVRSNQPFSGQTSYTQHETANFNRGAGARMHRNWLHGGAGGSSVGFNFVVDDGVIIQLTPLNEVTWAAGTPEGNKYSWHTELCVNEGINHTVARRNAAALAGGILAAMGWPKSKIYQHNIWWGKDCPYLLRRNSRWTPFVNMADDYRRQSLAAASGKQPEPEVPMPSHGIPGFDGTKNVTVNGTVFHADKKTIKITEITNARKYANTDSEIIRTYQPGSVNVLGWVKGEDVDGIDKWWIIQDGRLWAGTTEEEPAPAPPPEVPLIVTGKNIYNGRVFYSVGAGGQGRVVKIARAGSAYKYAAVGTEKLFDVKPGDEFMARLWCFGDEIEGERAWWLIGTGNENNPFEDCARLPAAYATERPE